MGGCPCDNHVAHGKASRPVIEQLLNKRARLWNSAELLVLVLSKAVLAIEKDGKSRANGFEHEHRRERLSTTSNSQLRTLI